jgi:hypothetical protein
MFRNRSCRRAKCGKALRHGRSISLSSTAQYRGAGNQKMSMRKAAALPLVLAADWNQSIPFIDPG